MINANKKTADVWGGASYKLPLPYLRVREDKKEKNTDEKKSRFVEAAGDGPAPKFGNSKRGRFYHLNTYGKDGKEPPHSYLPVSEWIKKKDKEQKKEDTKEEKKGVGGRGSFIDAIFFNGEKYKMPGPNNYFKEDKDKAKEQKKEATGEPKEKKKFERVNFLCDAAYLGMNNPCPGSYNLKVNSLKMK